MIIKKYKAATEKDAILMAKEDLGPEAVVMNVKTIKRKGIMKLFKKNTVELTAAIDDNVAEKPAKENYSDDAQNAIEEKINSIAKLLEQQMLAGNDKNSEQSDEEKAERGSRFDAIVSDNAKESYVRVSEEKNEEKSPSKNRVIDLIYNQLIENEVNKKTADEIISEMDTENKNLPLDNILANVYQKIVLKLGEVKPLTTGENKPKIVFFVGNTGVGKTTTMAKLASKFKLEEKQNIAMLSIDTYRIAAIEQIKTYANILNTPMEVVYTPEDIKKYVEKYSDCDLIFVDTAGHSHKNEEQKKNLKEDLLDIAKTYDKLFDYKLIFTKLDETRASGSILNLKLDMGKTLSYATWGQNVPEDIGVIDPQIVAKSLLGGAGDGSGF